MPQPAQIVGGTQAGRTAADDGHPFAGFIVERRHDVLAGMKLVVGGEALEVVDVDRFVQHPPPALVLAGMGADPAAGQGQGVAFLDLPDGFVVLALGDQVDIGRMSIWAGQVA
jgi:hypothetical protein